MNKQQTIQAIKDKSAKIKILTGENLIEIETVIKSYLREYPKDSEMWLRLAKLELHSPLEDPYRIENYLTTILQYDSYNIQAALMLYYIRHLFLEDMEPSFLENLVTDDPELLSMIEYAKALYYIDRDKEKYEKHLLKSIVYCNKHVNNLEDLAYFYISKGELDDGARLIRQALANIQHIYTPGEEKTDVTDINDFFNYYYKGTHTLEWRKEKMEQELLKNRTF